MSEHNITGGLPHWFRELMAVSPDQQEIVLRGLDVGHRDELFARWALWAHKGQRPEWDSWRVWLIRAGRGFGKTRAGAEWISQWARDNKDARLALVGTSIEDARKVMVEGPSGLIAVRRRSEELVWRPSLGELEFASGAKARLFSAAAPEKLRGPEHEAAWCDELGAWPEGRGDQAWDNLQFGMRRGVEPRVVVTTTPRPTALMRRVMALPDCHETVGRSAANPHLPASFLAAMVAMYEGTRLGRQELAGELLDDREGALWRRALLDARRVAELPPVARVVVGVDPPAGLDGDACGIVAVALGRDGCAYLVEDASVAGATPEGWARAVAACAARVGADRVIAEGNQGGEMVRSTLLAAEATLPVRMVHARHGKAARAEPVAALYERARAWHFGAFPALEDELCGLMAGGDYRGPGRSPDRADALVWAMWALMLEPRGAEAGVRGL